MVGTGVLRGGRGWGREVGDRVVERGERREGVREGKDGWVREGERQDGGERRETGWVRVEGDGVGRGGGE